MFRLAQKSQITQQTAFSMEACPQPAAENIIGFVCVIDIDQSCPYMWSQPV